MTDVKTKGNAGICRVDMHQEGSVSVQVRAPFLRLNSFLAWPSRFAIYVGCVAPKEGEASLAMFNSLGMCIAERDCLIRNGAFRPFTVALYRWLFDE